MIGKAVIKVSIVIPMRNEEGYIGDCLTSLLNQTYPSEQYEVIVVDGRSSDRSGEIVRSFQLQWPNVRLLDNSVGIVPTAMNLGIRNAQGEVLIRADAHASYPHDYIENCVSYLDRTGADNVGGPVVTEPANNSLIARLIAALLSSPFGVGNSQFRVSAREEFVDTVPFGAFRKELFDRVGMYNEKLVRNQDNDLNARIRKAGGKIYLTPALTTRYYPVRKFPDLLRKAFHDSQWHIFTLRQNTRALGVRHLVPAMFITAVMMLLCLGFVTRLALIALGLLVAIYFIAAICFGGRAASNRGYSLVLAMPFAFFLFHVAYGLGTLAGLKYLLRNPNFQPCR
jgi:glycosyltransferase involved in cell wall biosynthesis